MSGFSRTGDDRKRTAAFVPGDGAEHHVGHHVEEERIVVHRRGARHRQTDLAAHVGGLAIEVVQHLDVVADEADRAEDRGLAARRLLARR